MSRNLINKYFFVLFSIIPISIIVGPSVSLANILIIVFSFLIYIFYINDWSWLKDKRIKLLLVLYIYLMEKLFLDNIDEIISPIVPEPPIPAKTI